MTTDLGEAVTLRIKITDSTGVAADADSLPTWTVTLPGGTAGTPPAVQHAATGEYEVTYTPPTEGTYLHVWTAALSGVPLVFGPEVFHVRPASPGPLISLAEARQILGIGSDTTRDELLRDICEAATVLCEDYTGRTFRRRTFTETHSGGKTAIVLRRGPVQSVTTVTENGTVLTDGWVLDTASGILYRGSIAGAVAWALGTMNIAVTYVAGDSAVSARVRQANRVTVQHLWATQSGASGAPRRAVGASPNEYAPQASGWSLPRAAEELLARDVAPGFA